MFGGAYYHPPLHEHVPVDEHIWILDMKKFEWSLHSSLTLIRPMYFQAAAMNEVNHPRFFFPHHSILLA